MLNELNCVMVIFGGTGDLTHRKLIPAIYNLYVEKKLGNGFAVVSVGRREKDQEDYRNGLTTFVEKNSRFKFDANIWEEVKNRIFYYSIPFEANEAYTELDQYIDSIEKQFSTSDNRLFYLAVSPEYFGVIVDKINQYGLIKNKDAYHRVVIEKPFGRDLVSAKALSKKITDVFGEENTYRIDHYLGKEMLQNIMVIRFANAIFEPLWNNKHIDHIQISSSETLGVEDRAGYYEQSGALRDMLQNHMLQLLTLTAMEPPVRLDTESIRDEKVKVLKGLKSFTPEMVTQNIVRGQYSEGELFGKNVPGYRQENRVQDDSETETFLALKAEIENFRWSGVPFYIRTGKRLPQKSIEIIIQFKQQSEILYLKDYAVDSPNLLIIRIQPTEGVYLRFNAKKPGTSNEIVSVNMDFCQNCEIGYNSPEAYEKLIYDVLRGDSTLFTRWDEVEYSWKYIDQIVKHFDDGTVPLDLYPAGQWGPKTSYDLIERDGRKWWEV